MTLEGYCEARKVKQLQELVKQYGLHFSYNPYPKLKSEPNGEWRYCVNYSGLSTEQVRDFDLAWDRINTPINEIARKSSIIKRIIAFLTKSQA
ncbi:hypothetical protein THF1C08_50156 [Vibrio jasicida]|uniref:Uncharacterized protein n=1 Tax=Vibrio jasicida TaxID=766224 RepID=A0AAU9QTN5_9VIBR|nr:hypothetical protein THF1C08_50156 [Vibrio jasicida]CAH1601731.1 hypothetical protein THF1A12_50189 [Vibrio jasicida]